ncbi:hypothetical protein SLS60_009801 [Paraconiothyrium brasiliense]|uniref:Uncharacterized protein n=1 Tax=Paraconiothyrium brasiliense TaxID=300254 RepID=A0ABR3QSI4_9PLEO
MSQQSSSNKQQDVAMSNVDQTTPSQVFPSDRLNYVKNMVDELLNLCTFRILFNNNSVTTNTPEAWEWTFVEGHTAHRVYREDNIHVWIYMRFKDADKMQKLDWKFKDSREAVQKRFNSLEARNFKFEGQGEWSTIQDMKCKLKKSETSPILQVRIDVKILEEAPEVVDIQMVDS